MQTTRLLFVDDETGIRVTLPAILQQHGFEVHVAATVAEALTKINLQRFDVLISDLNIGHPGDGFTVISAMRRTQPHCVNLILTGYPAYESALRAIQAQVDDYLVKPSDIQNLVRTIRTKLEHRMPEPHRLPVRVSVLLRENIMDIQQKVLDRMKSDPELGRLRLSDEERADSLADVLGEFTQLLELCGADNIPGKASQSAARHGKRRKRQDYSVPMLIQEQRLIEGVIFDFVQDNILALDLSHLVTDLKFVVDASQWQLREATRAFLEVESHAA